MVKEWKVDGSTRARPPEIPYLCYRWAKKGEDALSMVYCRAVLWLVGGADVESGILKLPAVCTLSEQYGMSSWMWK